MKRKPKKQNASSPGGHCPVISGLELKVLPQFKAYFGYCLYKSAMRFRSLMDEALVSFGIITPQMGLLRLIQDVGPKSQQELGDMLGIDKASMVKFIDGLQKKKLVLRKTPQDRRVKLIEITEKGRQFLLKAAETRAQVEQDFLSPLTNEEQQVLKTVMPKLLR